MTIASHAFAPEFTHTAEAFDLRASFVTGSVDVNAVVATGTYRMCLAPSASDFIRAMEAALNAALALAVRTETVTCSLSAAGIFSITISDASDFLKFNLSSALRARLGFTGAPASGATATGSYPVWHLALLSAATGPYWQPMQAGGAEQTTGGRVYAIASTLTSWQRSLRVHFQPTTPTLRAAHSCDATAMYPAEEYMSALGSTATAREWSVLDVLYSARNALCGYTSTWGTARTTTSERIWRVYIGPETLLSTRTELLKAEWLAYCEWNLGLVAPSATPTETRA